jgi:hypothetical protein
MGMTSLSMTRSMVRAMRAESFRTAIVPAVALSLMIALFLGAPEVKVAEANGTDKIEAKTKAKAEAKAEAKPGRNQAYVHPEFASYAVKSIAIAPWTSVKRDPEAERVMRGALEGTFHPLGYRFLSQAHTLDLARRAGVEPHLAWLQKGFLASAATDSARRATLAAVGSRLSVDAILFANLVTWERYVVDAHTRGQSFTQIGAELALVSVRDGATLWRGTFLEKGDGPYNDPSAGSFTNRDAAGHGSTRSTAMLEPPSWPEVAQKLMERVAGTLPRMAKTSS